MWDFDTGVSYEIGYRSYIVIVIWTDYKNVFIRWLSKHYIIYLLIF